MHVEFSSVGIKFDYVCQRHGQITTAFNIIAIQ